MFYYAKVILGVDFLFVGVVTLLKNIFCLLSSLHQSIEVVTPQAQVNSFYSCLLTSLLNISIIENKFYNTREVLTTGVEKE